MIGSFFFVLFLAACQPDPSPTPAYKGDPVRGAELYVRLPCAGCHGATALGQFGPPLAGTTLSFEQVRQQVRTPRARMTPFDETAVSNADLRDIYAWLVSLPRPLPALTPASAPEATVQARDRIYPEMSATALLSLVDQLDEIAFRVSGEIVAVEESGRFSQVRVRIVGKIVVEMVGTYDTALARQPFPAAPGDVVTLYGVGTVPALISSSDGISRRLPRMQILFVVIE